MWRGLCMGSSGPSGGRAPLSGLKHRIRRPLPRAKTTVTTITTRRQCSGERSKPEAPPSQPPVPPPPPPRKPASETKSLLSVYVRRYNALLESRPLATKAVTSGVIAFAGDVTCQLLAVQVVAREDAADAQNNDELSLTKKMASLAADIDWARCARFTLLGTVLVAPALHYWYGFLHRQLPGRAATTVVKRVALDQLAFAPAFIATFLSSVMVLDGNAAKVESKLRADYGATVVVNWGYWIPAQVINFRFVAPVYQVLFANGVGFFWNIYLSYQSNKAVKESRTPRPSGPSISHNT